MLFFCFRLDPKEAILPMLLTSRSPIFPHWLLMASLLIKLSWKFYLFILTSPLVRVLYLLCSSPLISCSLHFHLFADFLTSPFASSFISVCRLFSSFLSGHRLHFSLLFFCSQLVNFFILYFSSPCLLTSKFFAFFFFFLAHRLPYSPRFFSFFRLVDFIIFRLSHILLTSFRVDF